MPTNTRRQDKKVAVRLPKFDHLPISFRSPSDVDPDTSTLVAMSVDKFAYPEYYDFPPFFTCVPALYWSHEESKISPQRLRYPMS